MPDPSLEAAPPLVVEADHVFGAVHDLERVLHHLHAGVVAHAADTSIRVCNPRACAILGLTMDQMVGKTAPDPQWRFLRGDGSDMPLEEYPVSVVLQTRAPLEDLLVGVRRPDKDEPVWAMCNGYPVFDEAGALDLAIITFIDVSAQREAERAREQLQAQLRHAVKMEAIGRLAGGVAHDFNNILTGILAYADLTEDSLPPDHPGREWTTEIREGGERAADLVKQLLAFARKQVVEPRVVQPNDIIARSEKMLGRLIGEDIRLVVLPGKDLGKIRIDPSQLDQILVNLAVNARDAMPGGGHLTVETANVHLDGEEHAMLDGSATGDFVIFAVSDDGSGMDDATRNRIFEPFYSTKAPGQGTGLGLATVYGIVSQNGGFISVYSELGHGTTFKLYLPAVQDELDALPRRQDDPIARGSATVLLVEDDDGVRELARKVLADRGYTVLEAAEADEALMLSRRFSGTIDLVLSDVVMPGLNGRDLVERLRVARPGLRALFMSGYTENVISLHGELAEGTEFLQKPFTARRLLLRVQGLLQR